MIDIKFTRTKMCLNPQNYLLVYFQGLVLLVITACDSASEEAKRTSLCCYKLLQRIAIQGFEDQKWRNDVLVLAIQSGTNSPNFTASGLFVIDKFMFFMFVGFLTSYLVVLIQFSQF